MDGNRRSPWRPRATAIATVQSLTSSPCGTRARRATSTTRPSGCSPRTPRATCKENNWLQTIPGKGWFVILRLCNPLQSFFDEAWRSSEIQRV
jgi:hypothetical protein